MRKYLDHITQFARSKTPDEWRKLVSDRLDRIRRRIRENGEKAALAAFGLGIVAVVFFKVVIVALALVALAYLTLLWLAES